MDSRIKPSNRSQLCKCLQLFYGTGCLGFASFFVFLVTICHHSLSASRVNAAAVLHSPVRSQVVQVSKHNASTGCDTPRRGKRRMRDSRPIGARTVKDESNRHFRRSVAYATWLTEAAGAVRLPRRLQTLVFLRGRCQAGPRARGKHGERVASPEGLRRSTSRLQSVAAVAQDLPRLIHRLNAPLRGCRTGRLNKASDPDTTRAKM